MVKSGQLAACTELGAGTKAEQFYAQRIGADDFMKKPFSRSEVFLRVEKLLGPDRVPKPHVPPERG